MKNTAYTGTEENVKRRLDSFEYIVTPPAMQKTLEGTNNASVLFTAEDGVFLATGEECQICGEGCYIKQMNCVGCNCRIQVRRSRIVKVMRISYEIESE